MAREARFTNRGGKEEKEEEEEVVEEEKERKWGRGREMIKS